MNAVSLRNVRDYYIGDDLKLKQVIINILGNSVKFTESSGKCEAYSEADQGRKWNMYDAILHAGYRNRYGS